MPVKLVEVATQIAVAYIRSNQHWSTPDMLARESVRTASAIIIEAMKTIGR
jgi:hypothetical protein